MILNQGFCFLAVYLYGRYSEEANADIVDVLFKIVGGLFLFSMLNFCGFLGSINRKYLPTFYSTVSGKQFTAINYHSLTEDGPKFTTFDRHRSYFKVLEPELKTWLEENWERWEDEKPEWFTPVAITTVPADLLPKKALSDMNGVAGRKASIVKMKKEKGKVGGERVRRGSDLKIIPMEGRMEE